MPDDFNEDQFDEDEEETPGEFHLWRPSPPVHLTDPGDEDLLGGFAPAPELDEWVKKAVLDESGPIFNPDHLHLVDAHIGYLWTNVACKKHGRRVVGMAEIPSVQGGPWIRGRVEYQLRQWFGAVPDFLITLDAPYAYETEDANFCATVDHELYHCGQRTGLFGEPKFRADGRISCCIKGHDVEEHIGVVRRWGVGAAAGGVADLVKAAGRAPSIATANIAQACGVCLGSFR